MDISIDSNIIRNDFFFKSKDFQILDDYLFRTGSQYVISEVVLQEVKQLYKKELIERIEGWKKSQSSVNNLLPYEVSSNIDKVDIDAESEKYMEFLRKTLRLKDSNIIKFKNDYLRELVGRAVQKVMPFKNEDKGFRDTIIWMSLKDYCKTISESQIIFISNNPTDFGNSKIKNKLNESLAAECEKEGIQINYFNTPKEFIEHHSTKIDFISKEWLNERLNDEEISEMVSEKLNSIDLDTYVSHYIDMPYGMYIVNLKLLTVNPTDYLIMAIYEMIDNTLIVNVTCVCKCEFCVDYFDINSDLDSDNGSQNKFVKLHADLSITVKEKEITDTVVDWVS
jgi:hypothetical protein